MYHTIRFTDEARKLAHDILHDFVVSSPPDIRTDPNYREVIAVYDILSQSPAGSVVIATEDRELAEVAMEFMLRGSEDGVLWHDPEEVLARRQMEASAGR